MIPVLQVGQLVHFVHFHLVAPKEEEEEEEEENKTSIRKYTNQIFLKQVNAI